MLLANLSIKITKPVLKESCKHPCFLLFWYTIGKLRMSMFLKHRGFAYFPIIKGGNLCDPSAFEHKATESHSLFFFRPERRLVASVRSGSSLQKVFNKIIF